MDAQVLLLQGADLLTIAEAVTMAPKEEQGALNSVGEVTKLTKNGLAVVKSIDLKDKHKNIRAKLAQDITTNTHEEAGVAP
ncbi:60 kDa heat shock protein, mitochondrial [Lemmus lemmus]